MTLIHCSLPQFPHLYHVEHFQMWPVAGEVVYGSNKHKLEYNPIFLGQMTSVWSAKQHWPKLRILCTLTKKLRSTFWITCQVLYLKCNLPSRELQSWKLVLLWGCSGAGFFFLVLWGFVVLVFFAVVFVLFGFFFPVSPFSEMFNCYSWHLWLVQLCLICKSTFDFYLNCFSLIQVLLKQLFWEV